MPAPLFDRCLASGSVRGRPRNWMWIIEQVSELARALAPAAGSGGFHV